MSLLASKAVASKWQKVADVIAEVHAAGALTQEANRAAFRKEQKASKPGDPASAEYYTDAALDARIALRYESIVQAELRRWTSTLEAYYRHQLQQPALGVGQCRDNRR